MATGRQFRGKRLAVTAAFVVLLVAAFGAAGCKGFFVNPNLTSITINPTAPTVQVGDSTTLSAYGVYSDGTGNYLTSGVSWSSSDISIATVSGTGGATLTGVATGSATITASSQAVTNTASATVFIVISAIGISPTNPSVTVGNSQNFLVYANNDPGLTNPNDDLSGQATLTVTNASGTQVSIPSCTANTSLSPVQQTCTTSGDTDTLPATYVVTASYPGSTLTAKTNFKVNPAP